MREDTVFPPLLGFLTEIESNALFFFFYFLRTEVKGTLSPSNSIRFSDQIRILYSIIRHNGEQKAKSFPGFLESISYSVLDWNICYVSNYVFF